MHRQHPQSLDDPEERIRQLESQIAEYEQQLTAFRNNEKRYQSLFQNLLHEVHIWELVRDDRGAIRTWRLVDANPAALESWGRTLPEIVGRTTDEIFPDADATETFRPIVEKIFAEQRPHRWENHFVGTDQALMMISVPVGDQLFISAGVDVSEHKRTEAKLKDTVLQLTESINAGNVGLWDWDLKTNRTRYSKEWKAQIGYRDDEIGDGFEEWQKRVHPEDFDKTLNATLSSIENAATDHETEFRFRHKDGSYRWILAHASVIRDESGNPVRMVGSHVDVTKFKLMEQAISQKRKTEAIGFLASGIAHDFNNLLAPILGYTELARLTLPEGSKEQSYLHNVQESANRAKELVKKILIINRSSQPRKELISLQTLIAEVATVLRASAPKNITLQLDMDTDVPPVPADPSQIYQVVLNLCTNSIQAMPEGGELHVRLTRDECPAVFKLEEGQSKGCVVLSVSDDGCGMDEATLAHVFDPFFTTKTMSNRRGKGLGLAMVSSIVQQHDGHIEVSTEPDQGTTFDVYFPIGAAATVESPMEPEPHLEGGQGRILLIDDERSLSRLNTTILEELGYEVTAFTDCQAALDAFTAAPEAFDLVITDYSMPEMTGPELIEKIRARRASVPTILLTGFSNLVTAENVRSWGCDAVIAKPCGIEELRNTVGRVLAK